MNSGCKNYDHEKIETFWQKFWDTNKTFNVVEDRSKEKYYVLDMFPYPSGAGLHIGHPEGYTASDILGRYKRANGYNVLHPMGWDAFGLPAEQHAIKTGINPADNTAKNVDLFRKQIKRLGFGIDWDREVNTTDPKYFRWTQWIFLQLFKHGLAYVDERPVWWCEELKSVLANEEVINGLSERGNFPVKKRNLRQWVLRITKYADKLIDGLDDIDWPDSTKRQQSAWIGKSDGANIRFKVDGMEDEIEVYTTRPDTIFGVTFVVLAPEHPLVDKLVSPALRSDVQKYIEASKRKSDHERTDLAKTKTGTPAGAFAINPANGKKIEIWIADYVLMSYGTGAIMAVPGHDTRDYEFAIKYGLPVIQVIKGDSSNDQIPYIGDGVLINSGKFNGLTTTDAKREIVEELHNSSSADFAINYKLRDWLFSRQRYWGEPIPIVWISSTDYKLVKENTSSPFHEFLPENPVSFEKDGQSLFALPLTSKSLPLKLPPTNNYMPSSDGESPLSHLKGWTNVMANINNGSIVSAEDFDTTNNSGDWIPGKRETNTMPQWAGSCWYYLRYMSPNCDNALVDRNAESYWKCPDFYIGGAEHAVLHLLYSRFWHRFLFDIGAIHESKEPFKKLFHQGIILGEDGSKMSKSRGNVINPDDVVANYGADALRLYEMFLGPLDMMKPWSESGIEGVSRFLKKVWKRYIDDEGEIRKFSETATIENKRMMHETIQKVTNDIESLKFNTAISQLMICLNFLQKSYEIDRQSANTFLQLLAPFAPHIAEELWARIGNKPSIVDACWPKYDKAEIETSKHTMIVQVNGKLRAEYVVNGNISEDEIFEMAMSNDTVKKFVNGKNILRKIYVKGKILNIVTD